MSTITSQTHNTPRSWLVLAIFLVVVIGVGAVIGTQTAPGSWYAELNKPPFNPPNWLFAPVWFTLYVLIAIAGWRTFMRAPAGVPMRLWFGQMALNWAWSPVWFGLHLIWPAFAIIALLFVLIIAFIVISRQSDPVSSWLFVPYALWVGFASLLNLSIGLLN
jgi:translocator protein